MKHVEKRTENLSMTDRQADRRTDMRIHKHIDERMNSQGANVQSPSANQARELKDQNQHFNNALDTASGFFCLFGIQHHVSHYFF